MAAHFARCATGRSRFHGFNFCIAASMVRHFVVHFFLLRVMDYFSRFIGDEESFGGIADVLASTVAWFG